MTEALIGSLIVAALAGLSYMAVKHPMIYLHQFVIPLSLIAGLLMAFVGIWNMSNISATYTLPLDKYEFRALIETDRIPWIYLWAGVGFFVYVSLLAFISEWIVKDQKKDK